MSVKLDGIHCPVCGKQMNVNPLNNMLNTNMIYCDTCNIFFDRNNIILGHFTQSEATAKECIKLGFKVELLGIGTNSAYQIIEIN